MYWPKMFNLFEEMFCPYPPSSVMSFFESNSEQFFSLTSKLPSYFSCSWGGTRKTKHLALTSLMMISGCLRAIAKIAKRAAINCPLSMAKYSLLIKYGFIVSFLKNAINYNAFDVWINCCASHVSLSFIVIVFLARLDQYSRTSLHCYDFIPSTFWLLKIVLSPFRSVFLSLI